MVQVTQYQVVFEFEGRECRAEPTLSLRDALDFMYGINRTLTCSMSRDAKNPNTRLYVDGLSGAHEIPFNDDSKNDILNTFIKKDYKSKIDEDLDDLLGGLIGDLRRGRVPPSTIRENLPEGCASFSTTGGIRPLTPEESKAHRSKTRKEN